MGSGGSNREGQEYQPLGGYTGWQKSTALPKKTLPSGHWAGEGNVGSQETASPPAKHRAALVLHWARVVGDNCELNCCQDCICNVEFRWESNEKQEENILVPLIDWFLYYI